MLYRLSLVRVRPFVATPRGVQTICRMPSITVLVVMRRVVHEVAASRGVPLMVMGSLRVDHLSIHLRKVPALHAKDLSPCHCQQGEAYGKSLLEEARHGEIGFSNAAARQPPRAAGDP